MSARLTSDVRRRYHDLSHIYMPRRRLVRDASTVILLAKIDLLREAGGCSRCFATTEAIDLLAELGVSSLLEYDDYLKGLSAAAAFAKAAKA